MDREAWLATIHGIAGVKRYLETKQQQNGNSSYDIGKTTHSLSFQSL